MTKTKLIAQQTLWQQHGKWLVSLFIVFLFVYGGMQFYGHYQSKRALKASVIYDKALSFSLKPDKGEATKEATTIIEQYPHTPYAPMAALLLAKFAFDVNKLEEAKTHLNFALKIDGPVQPIARVRLARVLADQKDLDGALKLLTEKKVSEGFITLFEETKGDVYLLQNNKEKAQRAYQTAIEAALPGVPVTRLQLKIADLGKPVASNK